MENLHTMKIIDEIDKADLKKKVKYLGEQQQV